MQSLVVAGVDLPVLRPIMALIIFVPILSLLPSGNPRRGAWQFPG